MAAKKSKLRYLAWSVGVLVIGGMLVSVMLPSLCRSRESANRVKCASNLKQIGLALVMYANDNAGHYPPSLSMLPGVVDITAEVMCCPSSIAERADGPDTAAIIAELHAAETNAPNHKPCLSYIYIGSGLTSAVMEDAILAYEYLENHDNEGANVLFGDGHVEYIGKKQLQKLTADAGIVLQEQ